MRCRRACWADFVSTGLGVLGLAWQSSPAVTEVEEADGGSGPPDGRPLPDKWSGVIQDTASTSTLLALICARERTTDYALSRGGLQGGRSRPLAIYVSAHSHSSVDKGALLAGFGRAEFRLVPFDTEYGMRADALEELVAKDLAAGAQALRDRRHRGHHGHHRLRSRPRASRRSQSGMASGSTWTRRWRAAG